jgi:hypothetical protein
MNLCLEASSLDELHGLIHESMHLLFFDLLSDNELVPFLKERGWRAVNLPAQPESDLEFDVPWELIVAGGASDSQGKSC